MNLPYLFEGPFPHPFLLAHLSREEQAGWVDPICFKNVQSEWMIKDCLKKDETPFAEWNATSVGNTAYVALHCSNEEAQKICEERLAEFERWCDQTFSKPTRQNATPAQWALYKLWQAASPKSPNFVVEHLDTVRQVNSEQSKSSLAAAASVDESICCYWHSTRPAVCKCTKCARLICVRCVMEVGGENPNKDVRNYCQPCGKAKEEENQCCRQISYCFAFLVFVGTVVGIIVKATR